MNLNQITISSNDVAKSVEFYQQLGLKLIVDSSPRYVRLECTRGNSTFSIHHSETPVNECGVTIYFECEKVDNEYERLKDLGIEFDSAPEDKSWLWREARLKDPDGNQLILYFAGKNRKNPPWRV